MLSNSLIILVFSIFAFSPLPINAGWFGPNNYDECILESMKGITSDVAARVITKSCREKFPVKTKEKPKSRKLAYQEISQLTGRAGLSYGNFFGCSLYNGNKNITISEISIQVTTTIGGVEVSRTYTNDVFIAPQSTSDIQFSIVVGDEKADYSWSILDANGY